jgi:hypothetical protein
VIIIRVPKGGEGVALPASHYVKGRYSFFFSLFFSFGHGLQARIKNRFNFFFSEAVQQLGRYLPPTLLLKTLNNLFLASHHLANLLDKQ